MTRRDAFSLLGVNESASKEEIKKAYRDLAKKYHPDTCEGNKDEAENKFKEINEAYQLISKNVSSTPSSGHTKNEGQSNAYRSEEKKSSYYNYRQSQYSRNESSNNHNSQQSQNSNYSDYSKQEQSSNYSSWESGWDYDEFINLYHEAEKRAKAKAAKAKKIHDFFQKLKEAWSWFTTLFFPVTALGLTLWIVWEFWQRGLFSAF